MSTLIHFGFKTVFVLKCPSLFCSDYAPISDTEQKEFLLSIRNDLHPYWMPQNDRMIIHTQWACMCQYKQEADVLLCSCLLICRKY